MRGRIGNQIRHHIQFKRLADEQRDRSDQKHCGHIVEKCAETTAVTTEKIAMIANGLPFATFALFMAMYSKTPVGLIMLMIIIMLTSRNMTFQSIPNSIELNASSCVTILSTIIVDAPTIASIVLCILSVTIRPYDKNENRGRYPELCAHDNFVAVYSFSHFPPPAKIYFSRISKVIFVIEHRFDDCKKDVPFVDHPDDFPCFVNYGQSPYIVFNHKIDTLH